MPRLQKDDVFRILTPGRVVIDPFSGYNGDPNKLNVAANHKDSGSDECAVADSLWVVTGCEMSGGGTGMGPHDVYPDGWGVSACEVGQDVWPTGRVIFFRQSGCFTNILDESEVERVGRVTETETVYTFALD